MTRYSLRRQRGFIYLTTGANGTGKTLFTLLDVREKQVKEGRSVYYHGFDMYPEKAAEFGWVKMDDPTKWQTYPKGAIFIIDEAHNTFPSRATGAKVPDYVAAMAEHRKDGYDFFFLDQGPRNIDKFLFPLIATPGWHRHLKRNPTLDMSSVLQWPGVNLNCDKMGSGKTAEVSQRAFPKDVYKWYKSADQHTAVKHIPKQVWVLLACVLMVPALAWWAWGSMSKLGGSPASATASSAPGVMPSVSPSGRSGAAPLTAAQYVDSFTPRLDGFPNTAPRYDTVTAAVAAPYPAACVQSRRGCECYSQQATRLSVPDTACRAIVAGGYFVDWDLRSPNQRESDRRDLARPPSPLGEEQSTYANPDDVRVGQMHAAMRADVLAKRR